MPLLTLAAFDTDDLAVISAHLQDAVMQPLNAAYLPREKRFALVLQRCDWERAGDKFPCTMTGVHFERVLNVQRLNIDPATEKPYTLLAITFEEHNAPSGSVTLHFAQDAAIRLDVECLEALMKDMETAENIDS